MIRTVDLPLKFPEHLLKPHSLLDVLLHQVLLGLALLEAPVIAFRVIRTSDHERRRRFGPGFVVNRIVKVLTSFILFHIGSTATTGNSSSAGS